MSKSNLSVGNVVVFEESFVALFERPELRNVLCEIVDARLANGQYVFAVAPISSKWTSPRLEVFGDDVRLAEGVRQ